MVNTHRMPAGCEGSTLGVGWRLTATFMNRCMQFEGYLSNLLAATLGNFINVDKEKLRVSLFSGKPCRPSGRETEEEGTSAGPDLLPACFSSCSLADWPCSQ